MMKRRMKKIQRQSGFTLIEIIITIILAALVGTAMFTYLYSSSVTDSPTAVELTRGEADIESIMEQIVLEYITAANKGTTPSDALQTIKDKVDTGGYDTGTYTVSQTAPTDANLAGPTDRPSIVVEIVDPDGQTIMALFTASRLNTTDPLIFH
jgi:prepilin-type N-terminal cleavage/methylation domain-containing protein